MNTTRYLVPILLLAGGGCQSTVPRTATSDADIAAIRHYDERWLSALAAGDAETLRELTDESHITFPSNLPPLEGREANYAANSKWFEKFRVVEHWQPRDIVVAGDWAYECGHFTAESQPQSGGEVAHFSGNYLRILRRQRDGGWKMIREMATSDQPLAGQK
jgi:ketosteroid isomerase-like protein